MSGPCPRSARRREHGDFLALRTALPFHLKGFITFGYKVGWRISEIASLTWKQVDLNQGIVRLEVGETKNDEARTVYLDEELREIFNQQWNKRKNLLPLVFLNRRFSGKIKRFEDPWNSSCRKVGLGYGYKTGEKYVEKCKDNSPQDQPYMISGLLRSRIWLG